MSYWRTSRAKRDGGSERETEPTEMDLASLGKDQAVGARASLGYLSLLLVLAQCSKEEFSLHLELSGFFMFFNDRGRYMELLYTSEKLGEGTC